MGESTPLANWQAKAAAKRKVQLAKIPEAWRLPAKYLQHDKTSSVSVLQVPVECGILTSQELAITEAFDAVSLAKSVQEGLTSAEEVATAFCKRAAIAQQLTCCLTETFFDEGIARGKWLDRYLAEHGKPVGPLHGVPISIKDSLNYVGVQSTLGLVSFLDHPTAEENSPLVDLLLELGAILYCKTNIPQSLMTADSHNNVFGRTLNPHKLNLTAGGSSGGEGALIALRGSLIGVGTDIGGSIRVPALCNGTYGFKPTPNRVPYGGQAFCSRRGSPGFPACAGPLAMSFDDVDLFMRSVIEKKPWDRDGTAIAIPWRDGVASHKPEKLRIGLFLEDKDLPINPPVRRALEEAVAVLTKSGHEIVKLSSTPSLQVASEITTDLWSMDNSHMFHQIISKSGEPIVPSLQATWDALAKREEGYSLDDLFEVNVARAAYKASWNSLWVKHELDVILCPGNQTTAVPHDTYFCPPAYTMVWNLLEYPAVIIPVGKVDKALDGDDMAVADNTAQPYQSDLVDGAPTCIQIVTRGFQDEELIAAARVIDRALRLADNIPKLHERGTGLAD